MLFELYVKKIKTSFQSFGPNSLVATKNLDKNCQNFILRAKVEKKERVKFWEPQKRLVWGR